MKKPAALLAMGLLPILCAAVTPRAAAFEGPDFSVVGQGAGQDALPGKERVAAFQETAAAEAKTPAAGDRAAGYTLVFDGFTRDEGLGIEEYLVEFSGYREHRLLHSSPCRREYRYQTSAAGARLKANLDRMLEFMDLRGHVTLAAGVVKVAKTNREGDETPDGTGPVALELSSGRGHDPIYRIGEKLNLLIKLDQGAWLYCFYHQADGSLLKILPNLHHTDPFLPGGRVHAVPGEIFPFDLNVTEPPGVEHVTCYAMTRDVTADLPAALQREEVSPLPPGTVSRLREIFRGIPGACVSEASLKITVNR